MLVMALGKLSRVVLTESNLAMSELASKELDSLLQLSFCSSFGPFQHRIRPLRANCPRKGHHSSGYQPHKS